MRACGRTLATVLTGALVAALGVPAVASAAAPDLQIQSIEPSRTTVEVGIPTKVKFVLYVRNNGDATSARTAIVGPVGGAGVFRTIALATSEEHGTCDEPGGDAPRCTLEFLARPQGQIVEVTDTVTATAAGTVTRDFTADVLAPDTEAAPADNKASVTLQAVPGRLPTVSNVATRSARALTAAQRRRGGIAKLLLTLDRAAEIRIDFERRTGRSTYRRWGEMVRDGVAGANSLVIFSRVIDRRDPPITATLRRMRPGTYRMTIVATDADGTASKPLTRTLVVPRKR